MLVIGLTGGIGSGKTVVSDSFARLGVPVIDTDIISRQLVAPGQPLLEEIIHTFGEQYLDTSGQLDRAKLRQLIFSDRAAKSQLEAMLHPAIRLEVQRQLDSLKASYALVVIPLLVESGGDYQLDRILLVDVPETVQIERIMQRDGINRDTTQNILNSQASRERRLERADDVIDNNSDLSALYAAVDQLHARYLKLASDG